MFSFMLHSNSPLHQCGENFCFPRLRVYYKKITTYNLTSAHKLADGEIQESMFLKMKEKVMKRTRI